MNLNFDLNQQQRKAVMRIEGPTLVLAGAGSGKTRVITYRTVNMIKSGIDPRSILTVTFTNKAASEMKERISRQLDRSELDGMWIGTFHSIGNRILSRHLSSIGYENNHTIYNETDSHNLIKEIIKEMNLDKETYNYKIIKNIISESKMNLIKPEYYIQNMKQSNINISNFHQTFAQIYKTYEELLKDNNAFDFDDLICKTIYLLRDKKFLLKKYQDKFKYLQVDEYQDVNHSQYILSKMLAEPDNNIFVVGDFDQCQPPGTQVLTTKGYKNIEDLDPETDKIPSYDRRASYIVGLTDKYGYKIEKAQRHFSGKLNVIKTEDSKISKCTPNHKWIIKWADKSKKHNVVYLMRKDDKYRVGWCQLFNADGAFHLGIRSRLEEADDTWILKVCDNKEDCYKWENIISAKYGIPQITFKETADVNGYLTNKVINGVYNVICSEGLKEKARQCLKDFDKDIGFPIWSEDYRRQRQGATSILKTQACNLIPELMVIPIQKKGKKVEWKKIIEIDTELYNGPVYSLNVEKHHKYISNGMITCNSIYAFRGADISNILNFEDNYKNAKTIKLERNYRSTKNIINASNNLIENNSQRKEKVAWTDKGFGHPVMICENKSPQAESEFVAKTIYKLTSTKKVSADDIAILYRSHYQSQPIEDKLIQYNIPYQIVSSSKFFDRQEVRNFLSYLKFLVNPDDNLSLTNVMNLYSNDVGPKTIAKMTKHARGKGLRLVDILDNPSAVSGIGKKRGKAIKDFYYLTLQPTLEIVKKDISLIKKVEKIYDHISYDTFLDKFENPDERRENMRQLISYVKDYSDKHSDQSLSIFLDQVALMTEQDDPSEEDEAVTLMTVHASKGTEHQVVFVIGMEEDVFPHYKSVNEGGIEDIEEERRLCYVAMTRAMDRLFLSYCRTRFNFGQFKEMAPSRFLDEIPMNNFKKLVNF